MWLHLEQFELRQRLHRQTAFAHGVRMFLSDQRKLRTCLKQSSLLLQQQAETVVGGGGKVFRRVGVNEIRVGLCERLEIFRIGLCTLQLLPKTRLLCIQCRQVKRLRRGSVVVGRWKNQLPGVVDLKRELLWPFGSFVGEFIPDREKEIVRDSLGAFGGFVLREDLILAQRGPTDGREHDDRQQDEDGLPVKRRLS